MVLARSALAGALLATVSLANPVEQDVETLIKKDVDTRYPYNGPTVVIGMSSNLPLAALKLTSPSRLG
jgi:hypothetical protein